MSASQPELGPAMRALPNDRWRKVVDILLSQGKRDATAAVRAAGYVGTPDGLRTTAYRLMHDERMQKAIHEEGQKRLKGVMLALALDVHQELLENPQTEPAARLKAVQMVYDRAGMHAVAEERRVVEHIGSDPDSLKRIEQLAKSLGLTHEQLKRLVGNRVGVNMEVPTTDAEYVEVQPAALPPPSEEPFAFDAVRLEDLV